MRSLLRNQFRRTSVVFATSERRVTQDPLGVPKYHALLCLFVVGSSFYTFQCVRMMSGTFLATESKKHQEPWQTAALDLPTVTDFMLVHFKTVCDHNK